MITTMNCSQSLPDDHKNKFMLMMGYIYNDGYKAKQKNIVLSTEQH